MPITDKTISYYAMPGIKHPVAFTKNTANKDFVIAAVERYFKVTLAELQKKDRRRHLVEARQILMYLLRRHTNYSLKEIGQILGGQDHTTVIHGIRTVQNFIEIEDVVADKVQTILALI